MPRALEQIRRMRGGAQSHLMRCDDGGYYVVKFQNNPQHCRVLVNELLGTKLAGRLGLPAVPVEIIEVSEELIRLTPELAMELPRSRVPCRPGLQFGSRYPGDPRQVALHDFLPDEQLRQVENLHDFARMLVFDKWTCNTNGRQTLFFLDGGALHYKARVIDQGFCFNAGEWNFPDAPLRGLYARNRVYEAVTGMESFAPWIARIEVQMTECVLDELIRPIPPEWYDDDNDALLRLLEHLHRRRTRVADLILEAKRSNRRPFPKWDETLSNALQLAPQKGTLAQDLDAELDRLYADHVALQRAPGGVGAPGSRAQMRSYCSQVFRQARLWERIEKSIPATEFTFPGDPMRLDYSYRRNGTRGFVHTLSVSRAPREAQNFAYTAERITAKAPWKTEFAAVTDVELTEGNLRHRFVRDTLRDAGVEPVPRDHFAVWVSKLKPLLQY